jgi:hypothetical protein
MKKQGRPSGPCFFMAFASKTELISPQFMGPKAAVSLRRQRMDLH